MRERERENTYYEREGEREREGVRERERACSVQQLTSSSILLLVSTRVSS